MKKICYSEKKFVSLHRKLFDMLNVKDVNVLVIIQMSFAILVLTIIGLINLIDALIMKGIINL